MVIDPVTRPTPPVDHTSPLAEAITTQKSPIQWATLALKKIGKFQYWE